MRLLSKVRHFLFGSKKGSSQGTPFFVPGSGVSQKTMQSYVEIINSRAERKINADKFPKGPPPSSEIRKDRRTELLGLTREILSESAEDHYFPAIEVLRSSLGALILRQHKSLNILHGAKLVNVPGLQHELEELGVLRANAAKLLSSHKTAERYYELLAYTLLELALFYKIEDLSLTEVNNNGTDL